MRAAQHWQAPRVVRWQDKPSKIGLHSARREPIVKPVRGQQPLIARPPGKMFAVPAHAAEQAGPPRSTAAASVAGTSGAEAVSEEAEVASGEAEDAAAGGGLISE